MLVDARESLGLLQKDVAQWIGKSQAFVSNYEAGDRKLDWVEVLSLLELFQLNEAKFLQEFRKRVVAFNETTEAAVLTKVAQRAKKVKVHGEISRLMREHDITPAEIANVQVHPSNRSTAQKSKRKRSSN